MLCQPSVGTAAPDSRTEQVDPSIAASHAHITITVDWAKSIRPAWSSDSLILHDARYAIWDPAG
jgi:hypothetical protein